MNNPTDPPDEEYRPRPGMPTTTGGSATASSGGKAAAAAAAAGAAGTSDVPAEDPPPGQAGSTVPAAVVASSSDRGRGTHRRTPRQGTVSYQEQVQAPHPSPCRGSREDRWNSNIEALRKYKEETGNCNVPRKYPLNQSLSEFVQYVRASWQDLSEDRIEMLEELGFALNAKDDKWNVTFNAVCDFFGEAGCSGRSMAALRREKPALYKWIERQRARYAELRRGKKTTMTEDKVSLLEGIGVDLDPWGKFAEGGGGGGSRRKSRKKKKASGPTSSGSPSSARAQSQNFQTHNRPGPRQMANQQGKIPAAGKAARGPQKQVARKRTGKGIETGGFEEPQLMSYTSDQPSRYHNSAQAQGAMVRTWDHATTASPTVAINQSGPRVSKESAYADGHQESSFGGVGIDLHPTDSPVKPPYDGSSGTGGGGIKRMEMDIMMSDPSYSSSHADDEARNSRTYDGPFSHQATSRHASAGSVANRKAALGTAVSAPERASYSDAAKASTSHVQVPVAQHQGRNAASLSSAAKIDARGLAIDSSQGQQRHSMEAIPKHAGWRSSDERRQHVQEVGGRGFNALSDVSTVHPDHDDLLAMYDYDNQVAAACMAGASDPSNPIDFRPDFLRADLDLASIGQVQTQRTRPTRKKTPRADKKTKPSTTANKRAKSRGGSGIHQGRRGTLPNQRDIIDPISASVDGTSTSHANDVPQDRKAADKVVWKGNGDQACNSTDQHNEPHRWAACGFARISTTATTPTRAAETTAAQADVGIITHCRGQGQQQRQQSQPKKVRFSEQESSHGSGAVNGHHNYWYAHPSDEGQYEQNERAASDIAINDCPRPSLKGANVGTDNLASTVNASQGQNQGQLDIVPDSVAGARADNNASRSVAVSPNGAPTGAPKADYDDQRYSESTDAPAIGDPQQDQAQDQEFQGREQEQEQAQNDVYSAVLHSTWDNANDPLCPLVPKRSEIDETFRRMSEAVGVEDPVRQGRALEPVTKESGIRVDLVVKYKRVELENPTSLEMFVGYHPVKEADFIRPIYKHRMRVLLKAKGVDVGDLPRDEKTLNDELEEGRKLLARENFFYNNPDELEKTIKRAAPTDEDIGIAPVIRELFRYIESIAGTETYDVFCNATGEKQREMIAEYSRKNPHNPAGLVSLDYTGPPGKRTFVEDPRKKKLKELYFVCPLIKIRMELMIEGLDRQRKRLISLGIFELFEENREELLAKEKERMKNLTLEQREQYVQNAREFREAMWSQETDKNGKKLTHEQQLDKAAYIFWWFYHHECLLDQCVSREHWVPNKDEVWIRPDLLRGAARVEEYFFGEERTGFKAWKAWEENFPIDRDLQPRQDFVSKTRREYLKWLEKNEKDWIKLFNRLANAGKKEQFEEAAEYWETLSSTWVEKGKQHFVDLLHYFYQQEQQMSQDGRSS